jgi:hypothetical protein
MAFKVPVFKSSEREFPYAFRLGDESEVRVIVLSP